MPIDEESDLPESEPNPRTGDEALLKEIRDKYRYFSEYWRPQREHRKKLMRYLCGEPWSDDDRKAREDNGRPCISHDELNQYVFQCVNAARQNKRGIKIEPAGNGATVKTAALRQDIARTIEYRSKAQSVYLRAYQDQVEGAYGFCRVSRRYLNDDTDEQEIVIKPINNPDSVLYSPECKEADWSDAEEVFLLDPMPIDDFTRQYPWAQLTSFSDEDGKIKSDWIMEKTVLVAEYWKIVKTKRKSKAKSGRVVYDRKVVQYLTNGVDILERNPQPGSEIPIPAFIGLQRFVDLDGEGIKRMIFALPSFALDPQMTLAYLASQEAEEAGLTPKSPYIGYVGQFETDHDSWENLTKVPRAYVQADPFIDPATGQVLPLPQRQQFTPNFQAYEVAKESARRAIQAAMGINPLPTAAQRQNEKSGVALQKIQAAQEVGSYHLVDGMENAIARTGRIVDSWMSEVYDTEREMGLHQADESRKMVTINATDEETGEETSIGDGEHDVTVGSGPSAASENQAAQDFLDLLVQELKNLPIAAPQQAKLLSLAIQQKQLGPRGDEMAEIISPSDPNQLPPAAQQVIGQAKQQLQHLNAYAQELEGQVKKLTFEKQAKIVEHQGEMELEKLKLENDLAKAEVTTKAQSTEERLKFVEDMYQQLHSQAHEAAMAAQNQAHTQDNMQQQAALEPQPEAEATAGSAGQAQ